MGVKFCKVFLPDRSSHQLLIPPAFVSEHPQRIRKKLVLEDLIGTQWRVEVERYGNRMFITKGWRDFVIDNSLEYGDFIVFTCRTKSLYSVEVFGNDSCWKLKGNGSFNVDDVAAFSKKDCRAEQTIGGSDDISQSQSISTDGMSGRKRKCNDRLRATPFVKAKTPYCIAPLTAFNQYTMRIPPEPLRIYAIKFAERVHLRDHNDKLWPVKVYITSNGLTKVLSSGWTHFRRHMKLECGDQCLFEFVLERGNLCKEIKIQVSYANARKPKVVGSVDSRHDGMIGKKRKRTEMLPATPLVTPDAPHCIVSIKHYHLYTMRLPPEPLREHEIELVEPMHLRDPYGKLWPMNLYFPADGQSVFLSTGWSDFCKHMQLQSGDQCLFEFVLERENICREVKAQISYANQQKPKILGSSFDIPRSQARKPEYDEKPKIMLQHVKPLVRPKAPHCIVFIKSYNLYAMPIPPTSLRENGIKLAENVCLRDREGRLWPVKIYFSADGHVVNLSTGWSDFRRHMNLKCGDQCLLEFVVYQGNICKEMKVEVFHAISETE